ncbi:GPO family capsid scaffolding protein [bacterium]|nr:GPO family capsid scaffolding protein [bacterium]
MEKQALDDKRIDGWWDVARVGRWRGSLGGAPAEVELTSEDLEQIAADYDPQLQEAPVTVEHMRSGPAHGWVESLRVAGDRLQARLRDLSAQLRDWLTSGAYRSRSIEMYKPFSATGRTYLGAVTFLGAAAPAVKGLSPEPSLLAEKEHAAHLECREMGLEEAPESQPNPALSELDETRLVRLEEETVCLRAALEQERAARLQAEAEMKGLSARLAEADRAAGLQEFERALEAASAEGCLTPAERKTYASLAGSLDDSGRAALLESVRQRNRLALFAELSAPETGERSQAETLRRSRARFAGFPEDPEHDSALELMAREPSLGFAEALARVRTGNATV